MKEFLLKATGVLLTLAGAALILISAYYPTPYLRLGTFGYSLGVGFAGLLIFVSGAVLTARQDEDLMEKAMDYAGKILNLV